MISHQVSMIAEICIRYGKICETVLRYISQPHKTASKINDYHRITIGVKKASGLKSCQASEVRISCED